MNMPTDSQHCIAKTSGTSAQFVPDSLSPNIAQTWTPIQLANIAAAKVRPIPVLRKNGDSGERVFMLAI